MGIGLLAASQRQLTPCISGASATGEERRGVRNCKESSHRSSVSVGQAGARVGRTFLSVAVGMSPFLPTEQGWARASSGYRPGTGLTCRWRVTRVWLGTGKPLGMRASHQDGHLLGSCELSPFEEPTLYLHARSFHKRLLWVARAGSMSKTLSLTSMILRCSYKEKMPVTVSPGRPA